jgi:hypothetical protein
VAGLDNDRGIYTNSGGVAVTDTTIRRNVACFRRRHVH